MNKLISIFFAMAAGAAVAGDVEYRDCGDGYIGTPEFYDNCKVNYVEFCVRMGFDDNKCEQAFDDMPRKARFCGAWLGVSDQDFEKLKKCYGVK